MSPADDADSPGIHQGFTRIQLPFRTGEAPASRGGQGGLKHGTSAYNARMTEPTHDCCHKPAPVAAPQACCHGDTGGPPVAAPVSSAPGATVYICPMCPGVASAVPGPCP